MTPRSAARAARASPRTIRQLAPSSASTSGRRRPPTSWPSRFSAALTGIGLEVMNSAVEDVAQRRVDLRALVGLVEHPPHLVADDVRGDADAAGAAHVAAPQRGRRRCRPARQPVDRAGDPALLACLTASIPSICAELGQQVGRHVDRRCATGCCRRSPGVPPAARATSSKWRTIPRRFGLL